MARPKKVLDEKLIADLAGIACTVEEIALICKCCKDTLERNYSQFIEEGRAHLRSSLRRKQYEVAMNDDAKGQTTMLIWLGKQLLEQKDISRIELDRVPDDVLAKEVQRRLGNAAVKP